MSLGDAVRSELLLMRKHRGGATVAALARTDAIRHVLGGGDPRVAYNALKHILLNSSDDLAVTAASYSLGFASDGATHLDRLTDFGLEHGYDQRQARRYSDKGVQAVARQIGSEWVLGASPVLRISLIRWDSRALEAILRTERLHFIEMREPRGEVITQDGTRSELRLDWIANPGSSELRGEVAHLAVFPSARFQQPAVSLVWSGELWPKFEVARHDSLSLVELSRVETLGARIMVT
jgi:hypothetical protein